MLLYTWPLVTYVFVFVDAEYLAFKLFNQLPHAKNYLRVQGVLLWKLCLSYFIYWSLSLSEFVYLIVLKFPFLYSSTCVVFFFLHADICTVHCEGSYKGASSEEEI